MKAEKEEHHAIIRKTQSNYFLAISEQFKYFKMRLQSVMPSYVSSRTSTHKPHGRYCRQVYWQTMLGSGCKLFLIFWSSRFYLKHFSTSAKCSRRIVSTPCHNIQKSLFLIVTSLCLRIIPMKSLQQCKKSLEPSRLLLHRAGMETGGVNNFLYRAAFISGQSQNK